MLSRLPPAASTTATRFVSVCLTCSAKSSETMVRVCGSSGPVPEQ